MIIKNLDFIEDSDMFGTNVRMVSDDGKYDQIIAQHMQSNPLEKMVPAIDNGYMFRSPGIQPEDWQSTFDTLLGISGAFSMRATLNEKNQNKVTALIEFSDKNDAAVFAWSNMSIWQKWSKDLEKEAQTTAQESSRLRAQVDEHGNIKVKVTVTTLDK